MSAISTIQWTDRTWNPVRGCSVISPGCVNCYAMKQAHRFSSPGRAYAGLTKQTKAGPQWTGEIQTVESALLEPLSWRKPARVFVNSMSDLFHDDVPDEFIDKVFAVMAARTVHTFQILTKRADRMRAYMTDPYRHATIADAWTRVVPRRANRLTIPAWPFAHVWLGVSVEDQQRADERIPLLLETPAAVRFISAEPLLGPVNFTLRGDRVPGWDEDWRYNVLSGEEWAGPRDENPERSQHLDWVIVGGESGPGARLFDLAWARDLVRQCKGAHVPVFVKQLGAVPETAEKCGDCDPCTAGQRCYQQYNVRLELSDKKGGDMSEWPADLRIRQFPLGVEASTA